MAAVGSSANVDVGVGRLWVHAYDEANVGGQGTAYLPTDINANSMEIDPDSTPDVLGWEPIGYTEEGSTFSYEVSAEPVTVAEEIDEIATYRTSASGTVAFSFAEATARNLSLALNAGIAPSAPVTPVSQANEARVSIVFDAENGARWVFPKLYQAGSFEISNRKAPEKRLIGVEFKMELAPGESLMYVYANGSGLI